MHHAERHQAVDRLQHIDGMAAGDGNAGRGADRFAAGENLAG